MKPQTLPKEESIIVKGVNMGLEMAITHARAGRLRLSPMAHEKDEWPYTVKLRPFKMTLLIWKSWYREKRKLYY